MPTTPVLMIDNVFDRVNQYRSATISASSEVVGREAYRVGAYRRDRQWWQATGPGSIPGANFVAVDLGAGNASAPDYMFIDRGHNLWGQTIFVKSSDDFITFPESWTYTVPPAGTVGGNPTSSTLCVTEEGALYGLHTAFATARRYFSFAIQNVAGFTPVIAGLMLGKRTQLLGYSAIFDEDAGGRKLAGGSAESDAGYQATGRAYSWRTLELDLKYIGATEYDATMRQLRRLLFERNTPFVACMDYTTRPERAWMYQYDGNQWGFPKQRVYRSGRLRCRELAPKLDG